MFADYRVPQILCSLGCIGYSPPLDVAIKEKRLLEVGGVWEMQLRGLSHYMTSRLYLSFTTPLTFCVHT